MTRTIRRKAPIKRPILYGPTGKPIAFGLYPSPRSSPHNYRARPTVNEDIRAAVTGYDRKEMVNYSRQLFAQLANLGSAIIDKNFWAFGDAWEPHYVGTNVAWGEEAR